MLSSKFRDYIAKHACTLLGVGPMSLNCVNATIKLANVYQIPIMMIASRNQIDSEEFGGGYVNHWTTETFAKYVQEKDKKGCIFLARDHGGLWQNKHERDANLGFNFAMESAKRSLKADITAGFQIIHIDPSIDIHSKPTADDIIDRIIELYIFCWKEAEQLGRNIIFEIGTEEQVAGLDAIEDIEYSLQQIQNKCNKYSLPLPTFIVMQTGSKVVETRNIGVLNTPFRIKDEIPPEIQVPRLIGLCKKYNIMLKQHNTDYLSADMLKWIPRLGIHAANVAPEFGVVETKALLKICYDNKLNSYAEEFLSLAYNSKKWDKWITTDSKATQEECAIMAGHYIFSSQDCIELKEKIAKELAKKSIQLDPYLENAIENAIMKYLINFKMVV